jgi:hypothetical protein
VDAIHAAFSHKPGEAASSVFERMRRMPTGSVLPVLAQPEPQPQPLAPIGPALRVPTFAALHGVPGEAAPEPTSSATPHVDTREIDEAKRKAAEAGEQIKQSLDVTASPTVDASSIDAFLTKLYEARSLMQQLSQMSGSIRRGGFGLHALHDGPEAH